MSNRPIETLAVTTSIGSLYASVRIPQGYHARMESLPTGTLDLTLNLDTDEEAQRLADIMRGFAIQIEGEIRRRRRVHELLREGIGPCDAGVEV
jgi:hypothetical protein